MPSDPLSILECARSNAEYNGDGAIIDLCETAIVEIKELRARIAELERENAELKIYKRRWETVERLAESRGFTSHEWVILFKTGDLDFASAVDDAGREGA